jgi:hypothetical protein
MFAPLSDWPEPSLRVRSLLESASATRISLVLLALLVGATPACGSESTLVIGRHRSNAPSANEGNAGSVDLAPVPSSSGSGGDSLNGGSGGEPPVCGAETLTSGLLHRYDFSNTGTSVEDLVGTAHGTILGGAALDGSGRLVLDGVDDFVDLPNRILSILTDASLLAWVTWLGSRVSAYF